MGREATKIRSPASAETDDFFSALKPQEAHDRRPWASRISIKNRTYLELFSLVFVFLPKQNKTK